MREVERRLQSVDVYYPGAVHKVFVCHSQSLYNLFARLTLVSTRVPGFNLSLLDHSFLSVTRLSEINQIGNGQPRYSTFEGDLIH